MSELALKLIEENKRKHAAGEGAAFLDLGNCGLTDELPKELFNCEWLEGLNFGDYYLDFEDGEYVKSSNKGQRNKLGHSAIFALQALKKIRILCLTNNQISDLSPLGTLSALNTLYISYNQIIDLSPLGTLVSLNTLDISSNQIGDLSPLGTLVSLNTLVINSNQIIDLSPLGTLVSLNTLNAWGNQIIDLSPLGTLVSLNTLNAWGNQIIDLSPLGTLVSLNTLDISSNQISDLSPLGTLAALNTLDISANQISDLSPLGTLLSLNTLDISVNQISDLSPLGTLLSLNSLYISNNQISDLSPLSALSALNSLSIRENQISDLSPLSALSALNSLSIRENQISDLSPLSALSALNLLDISVNQISDFNPSLLNNWPRLEELDLSGNGIENVPSAIYNLDNSLQALKNYFKDLEKEPVPVYESKLILIGNGRVGKTCLLKRMLDNTFDPHEPSTHAIQLRQWQLKDLAADSGLDEILLNIWDFGGQDIYHATHRLFMQTDALFLLVWDDETEKMPDQKEIVNGKTISYKNHDLRYWLSYIKTLSNNSPVIVVQTKMDSAPNANTGLTGAELKKFNVIHSLAVESSRRTANGFGSLEERINQAILQQTTKVCTTLPAQWYRVRQTIENLREGGITCLSLREYTALCGKNELDESSTRTLIDYLHNTGVVFYKEGLFGGQLIIDQKWAIDAVYAIFDRKGSFTKWHEKGIFSGEDLQEIWREKYTDEEQELFLDFMLRCEICFEVGDEYATPFTERKFIAPQLLPETIPEESTESIASAFRDVDSLYIKYKHRFLHDAVIQRFIVRTGNFAKSKEMWRQGILLRPADGDALIEADAAKNEITVRVKNGNRILMEKIENELKDLTKGETDIKIFYSFNGQDFVSLEKIRTQPAENKEIETTTGKSVLYQPYRVFLNPDEKIRFEQSDIIPTKNMDKPKVFFSYAWNEASEELVTQLYNSLKADKYEVVRDKNDLDYKELISDFMKTIGRGNCVIVAISDKYLTSDNCMYELYELFRNSGLKKEELLKKIYPIRIESINLNDTVILRKYLTYWKNREEEYRALVNDFGFDQQQQRKIEAINNACRDLLPFLNDINSSTKEILSADNFAEIKKAIENKITRA